MKTSAALFEAYLKCPTKCWRRAQGEVGDDNAYATRVRAQTESYATDAAKRLANEIVPPETVATAPELADLKTAKWRLALDVTVRTPETSRSSRREEAPSALPQLSTLNAKPSNQSLVTPAAAVSDSALESRLHAVERGPAEGRGAENASRPAKALPVSMPELRNWWGSCASAAGDEDVSGVLKII